MQKLRILKFGGVTFGADGLWKALHPVLLEHSCCGEEALQSTRGPVSSATKCGPQSHHRHGTAVDKGIEGAAQSLEDQYHTSGDVGPLHLLNLNLQAPLHPATGAGSGLHTQLQLWPRSHTYLTEFSSSK